MYRVPLLGSVRQFCAHALCIQPAPTEAQQSRLSPCEEQCPAACAAAADGPPRRTSQGAREGLVRVLHLPRQRGHTVPVVEVPAAVGKLAHMLLAAAQSVGVGGRCRAQQPLPASATADPELACMFCSSRSAGLSSLGSPEEGVEEVHPVDRLQVHLEPAGRLHMGQACDGSTNREHIASP